MLRKYTFTKSAFSEMCSSNMHKMCTQHKMTALAYSTFILRYFTSNI